MRFDESQVRLLDFSLPGNERTKVEHLSLLDLALKSFIGIFLCVETFSNVGGPGYQSTAFHNADIPRSPLIVVTLMHGSRQ